VSTVARSWGAVRRFAGWAAVAGRTARYLWAVRAAVPWPVKVILAHDAGGHDTQHARKRGRYIMIIQPVIPGQFAPAKLCDPCFEDVTSMVAQVCRDRAGLCSEQAEEPCSRCGETADRLTVWQPGNDTEAAACQPVTFELTYWVPTHYRAELNAVAVARKLRDRGRDDAAAIAGKIARGEITGGDATDEYADEAAPNGPALHELAYAICKEAIDLGVAGPNGEADDWDSAETYHVYAPGEHGTLEGQ
jgi:hypothetical protein